MPVAIPTHTRRAATLAMAVALLASSAPAAAGQKLRAARAAAPALVQGPSVEGITEYALPNGLRVLLFPDQSKPTATVNITYLVGSRHEAYGETGMAHLLEHLLFKGTPRHPNIPQELTRHGASPNGTTWLDRTNYFETFAATDSNLAWALDLEADRMVHSNVARKDLVTEFSVVRNEFEAGENSPFNVLMERVISTAFLWHNYGNTTIGARSDIENVPIERLQGFYRKYYQPDNAVLVVAGKFDEARAKQLIREKFGRIARPARTGPMQIWATYTSEPTQDGERSVTLRRVGDVQVAMAAYHVAAGTHADYPAVQVLEHVLGDAPSGRLYEALVKTKKAADVGTLSFQLKEPGVLLAYAQVRQDDSLSAAEAAMRDALAAVLTRAPSAEEVERAKAVILKNFDLTLNNSQRAALALTEWASLGDWRMMFVHRDRVGKVTTDDVARVAALYMKPANATYGRFVPTPKPDRSEVPAVPDVAALVKQYRGDSARSAGEVFDPSPANIDTRTSRSMLPNGLEFAFLPKRTRGGTVNGALTLRFGQLETVMGKGTVGSLTAGMLMRGTRTKSRQQIKDAFDRLKANVSVFGGATSVSVRIEATRANLPEALQLVGEVLREPAFDPTEFDELKRQNLASLEEQRSEPTTQGSIAFGRYMNPYPAGDPRATLTIEEQVAAYTGATLDQVKQFYRDFYGADHAQLALVGDFDSTATRALLTSLLGDWKSPQAFVRVPSAYNQRDSVSISIETPDKANAFFLAGLNLELRDDDPAYPALVLGNYMLGGGFLNSRLATRIRQKEGISYGVGSSLGASSLDRSGAFVTYAIYAPENAARLEAAFREEMARMLRDGFTANEVEQARQGWLQSREVSRAQDASLAGVLMNGLFTDRTLAFDAAVDARVRALTAADVNAAMRKFIDPARIAVVKAGDFNKKAPAPQP